MLFTIDELVPALLSFPTVGDCLVGHSASFICRCTVKCLCGCTSTRIHGKSEIKQVINTLLRFLFLWLFCSLETKKKASAVLSASWRWAKTWRHAHALTRSPSSFKFLTGFFSKLLETSVWLPFWRRGNGRREPRPRPSSAVADRLLHALAVTTGFLPGRRWKTGPKNGFSWGQSGRSLFYCGEKRCKTPDGWRLSASLCFFRIYHTFRL